jgi:hypothetical protein
MTRDARSISRVLQLMLLRLRAEDRAEWGALLCGFTRTERVRLRVPVPGKVVILS